MIPMRSTRWVSDALHRFVSLSFVSTIGPGVVMPWSHRAADAMVAQIKESI